MHHGDATGSVVGHVTGNRLTFLRRQRAHQRCLVLELGFEDAEIRRLSGPQGLHIERIAAGLEARHFAHKRQVGLDVIFPEMRGVLGLIVEDEELYALNASRFHLIRLFRLNFGTKWTLANGLGFREAKMPRALVSAMTFAGSVY